MAQYYKDKINLKRVTLFIVIAFLYCYHLVLPAVSSNFSALEGGEAFLDLNTHLLTNPTQGILSFPLPADGNFTYNHNDVEKNPDYFGIRIIDELSPP